MKPGLKLSFLTAAFLAAAGGSFLQWRRFVEQSRAIDRMQQTIDDITNERAQLKRVLATGDHASAVAHTRAEIARTRQEIAGLELRLQQAPPPKRDQNSQFTANRE